MSFILLGCVRQDTRSSIKDAPSRRTSQQVSAEPTFGSSKSSTDDASCPVSVRLLSVSQGKPPQKIYNVKLNLLNRRPESLWLVFRYDQPLLESGQFRNGGPNEKQPFSSKQYTKKGGNGRVVTVDFLGQETFTAIRVPKGANIYFDSYGFWSFEDVSEFEVWEADSLLVNGKIPLEEWLPYQVLSDQSVHLGTHENLISLNWDTKTNGYRRDYPDQKVEFVTAHALNKCRVPLKQ